MSNADHNPPLKRRRLMPLASADDALANVAELANTVDTPHLGTSTHDVLHLATSNPATIDIEPISDGAVRLSDSDLMLHLDIDLDPSPSLSLGLDIVSPTSTSINSDSAETTATGSSSGLPTASGAENITTDSSSPSVSQSTFIYQSSFASFPEPTASTNTDVFVSTTSPVPVSTETSVQGNLTVAPLSLSRVTRTGPAVNAPPTFTFTNATIFTSLPTWTPSRISPGPSSYPHLSGSAPFPWATSHPPNSTLPAATLSTSLSSSTQLSSTVTASSSDSHSPSSDATSSSDTTLPSTTAGLPIPAALSLTPTTSIAAPSSSTASSSGLDSANGSSMQSTTTASAIAGGVVGGAAGIAFVVLLLMVFLRWYRRRQQTRHLALPSDPDGSFGRPFGRSSALGQGGDRMDLTAALSALVGFFGLAHSRRSNSPLGEKSFSRISGRKLPSIWSPGMEAPPAQPSAPLTGGDRRSSIFSVYRDEFGSPVPAPTTAAPTGWDLAPTRPGDIMTVLPGPQRQPVIHHGTPDARNIRQSQNPELCFGATVTPARSASSMGESDGRSAV